MRYSELAAVLDATGWPWRCGGWNRDTPGSMPFVSLTQSNLDTFASDNSGGALVKSWRIELYTPAIAFDEADELSLILSAAGFPFTRDAGGRAAAGTDAFVTYFNTSTMG